MQHAAHSVQQTMRLAEFLEYLRARSSTRQLGTYLAEVLALRGLVTAVPLEVESLLQHPSQQAVTRIGLGARSSHAASRISASCGFWNVRRFGPLSYAEQVPVRSSGSRTRPA